MHFSGVQFTGQKNENYEVWPLPHNLLVWILPVDRWCRYIRKAQTTIFGVIHPKIILRCFFYIQIWVFLILVYLRCSHLAITDVWHWLKGEPNSLLCLDHHLAGVVPCEESHQGLGHLVEAVHNRLSHLDNKRTWQQDDMMEWQSYKSCRQDCSSPWSCRRQPSLPLPQSPPPTVVSTWAD